MFGIMSFLKECRSVVRAELCGCLRWGAYSRELDSEIGKMGSDTSGDPHRVLALAALWLACTIRACLEWLIIEVRWRVPNFITDMVEAKGLRGNSGHHIIVMGHSLISTVGEYTENVVSESLVASSGRPEGVENNVVDFKLVFNFNSSECCQGSTKWVSGDDNRGSGVCSMQRLNTWHYLGWDGLKCIIETLVNHGACYSWVWFLEEVKVSNPIGDVDRASKCDYNLIFAGVKSDISKCSLGLIVYLSDWWESSILGAWGSTGPRRNSVLVAVSSCWVV